MLALIAESKAMAHPQPMNGLRGSTPLYAAEAADIMHALRGRSVDALAAELKLGPKNAQRLFDAVYEFPHRLQGFRAIDAFTGVVFQALEATSLGSEASQRMEDKVRIISSLYGILRPSDLIQPYRFDFGMKLAPGSTALSTYWNPMVTEAIIKHLKDSGETEILNILPADAAKCIDWKAVAAHASVYTAAFRIPAAEGKLVNPHSEKLKTLRGRLLRHILTDGIDSIEQLRALARTDMSFYPEASTGDTLVFLAE